jgi:hypothetical protein
MLWTTEQQCSAEVVNGRLVEIGPRSHRLDRSTSCTGQLPWYQRRRMLQGRCS